MERPSVCAMRLRIAWAALGVFIGLNILIVFSAVYHNYHAAIWGGLSGVGASILLVLHVWFNKEQSGQFKLLAHRMKPLMIIGCFIQLAGVCGIVAYLTVAIFEHQALTAEGRGFYLAAVWCFVTWKSGFLLFWYARQYRKYFRIHYRMNPDVPYQKF